jgi:hypothetical protein
MLLAMLWTVRLIRADPLRRLMNARLARVLPPSSSLFLAAFANFPVQPKWASVSQLCRTAWSVGSLLLHAVVVRLPSSDSRNDRSYGAVAALPWH